MPSRSLKKLKWEKSGEGRKRNSQLHKSLYQLFHAGEAKKTFRKAAKDGLLQDKSEQDDIIPESVVLGLHMKDLVIQIFIQSILFSTDYMKIIFWAFWKMRELSATVKIQVILKTL